MRKRKGWELSKGRGERVEIRVEGEVEIEDSGK